MERVFVAETDEHIKPRVYSLVFILCLSLAAAGYVVWGLVTGNTVSFSQLIPDFDAITPVTLFYSGAISGLFFVPVPLEFVFFTGVKNGSPLVASIVASIGGFLLGNLLSYLAGWKLSRTATHLISAKKLYGLRRKVNTYGQWAVLLVNIVPGPSPQLTFALALARYNMARLFTWFLIGNTVKYCAIAGFVLLT